VIGSAIVLAVAILSTNLSFRIDGPGPGGAFLGPDRLKVILVLLMGSAVMGTIGALLGRGFGDVRRRHTEAAPRTEGSGS
jgi:hypothetical protein